MPKGKEMVLSRARGPWGPDSDRPSPLMGLTADIPSSCCGLQLRAEILRRLSSSGAAEDGQPPAHPLGDQHRPAGKV